MSTTQIAMLGRASRQAPPTIRSETELGLPAVRLVAFAVLALYGTLRWSTLLSAGPHGRLLGLLGLAVLLAAVCPTLARLGRPLAVAAALVGVLGAFAVAGVPLQWVLHLRIAVTATAIGEGLSALPQVFVPYAGVNEWVRLVIVLGAAVLLLAAALAVAFAPRRMGELRRCAAALPLVALATVPETLVRSRSPYLDGLVLFVLLAAFIWGERIRPRQLPGALAICTTAAAVGAIAGPALDRHKPWIDPRTLAGSLAPAAVDTFDWSQSYGPIDWPRRGRTVLEIKAARPEYWKAEDLDVFDGRAWSQGLVPGDRSTPPPSPAALRTWSQAMEVTIRNMSTSDVIGAGVIGQPAKLSQPVVEGFSWGTWTTASDLRAGDSYEVRVYAPHPTTAQLQRAGTDYSGLPSGYRTILLPPVTLPGGTTTAASPEVVFPPFHSGLSLQNVLGVPVGGGPAILDASHYARAYALAQRLARRAATPYAFALAVEEFLAHGYSYSENPPFRLDPLESFLFVDKRGYCQHFAGAMALLLRMGGVPARVAVGFTTGHEQVSTRRWLVSDVDAHAWVEAWFPSYGWVRFDPTPAADPALGGRSPIPGGANAGGAALRVHSVRRPETTGSARRRAIRRRPASTVGGLSVSPLAAALGFGAVALLAALLVLGTRPVDGAEALVAELEQAMARSRRPLAGGATLASLERWMHGSEEASAYVRALRLRRFGGAGELPTASQRRALRRELGSGLGPFGRLRAVWALPPRRRARSRARPRRAA